jgi:hypothetical protein
MLIAENHGKVLPEAEIVHVGRTAANGDPQALHQPVFLRKRGSGLRILGMASQTLFTVLWRRARGVPSSLNFSSFR